MKLDDLLVSSGPEHFKKLVSASRDFLDSETIIVDPSDIKDIAEKSWNLIHNENKKHPQVYLFGQTMAVVDNGTSKIGCRVVILEEVSLRHRLIRWATWIVTRRDRVRPYVHSEMALKDILVGCKDNLPYLEGIVSRPIFALDGELITKPGYNPKTKMYYQPPPGFVLPPVSKTPSSSEFAKAKDLILVELLGDFPFASESDLCNAITFLLVPFIRPIIAGFVPLYLIEKSTVGTGATLLARTISHVCTGKEFTVLAEGRDGEEWRKRLTAILRNSPEIVVIDNLSRPLDSSSLAVALTSPVWGDRILGHTKYVEIPISCIFAATGNNPILSYEITRRAARVRLDAKSEFPFLRKPDEFRHPNLIPWTMKNRPQLVWAILIIIQHWVKIGMPKGDKTFGSFENWASVMGGVLKTLGINGFLDNIREFYEDAQSEQEQKKQFVLAWFKKYRDRESRVADLCFVPGLNDLLPESSGSQVSQGVRVRLGFFIKKLRDQVFELDLSASIVIVRVKKSSRKIENTTAWRLEILSEEPKAKIIKKGG